MNAEYLKARNIALTLLDGVEIVSASDVGQVLTSALSIVVNTDVDQDRLRRDIESRCNVWVPSEQVLNGQDDHQEWLDANRGDIDWNFWERYRRYLGWGPAQVRGLDQVTDRILSMLEKPTRPGKWDRRGMVVGQVQSGKTANYTGVISKAADAGYKLIIVLAGLHNSLRSQTQHRLDMEFLGFDTRSSRSYDQNNARVGVGAMRGKFLHVHSLTSSDEKGDFQVKVAKQVWVQAGGNDPVVLVVKKNASVLKNLYNWATGVQKTTDPETGLPIVRAVPLLVIDDEADNASVNTKARPVDENGQPIDEYDPTKINGWIRQLLRTFEKSVYLAYTATPFANIFIDGDERTEKYGEDLFPRSFIINLRPPSNYTGVARVFGLDSEVGTGIEGQEGLPVVKTIDDHEVWMPDKHKKDLVPDRLPQSLLDAINSFLLATAARRVRGQNDHNSMLVHVTRFTDVQALVWRAIHEHLELLRQRIWHGDENSPEPPWRALQDLWRNDFVPITHALRRDPQLLSEVGDELAWDEIRRELPTVLDEVELRTLNGTSEDSLVYSEDRPLTVIAIGGDKLSRGLTLEGLTVSYYLRASKMYDTLMQMGRWFGYRPEYLDVCRLYTTAELAGWYRDIALAHEELLREFEYMAALNKTPKDYGLRVRAHPDGLMITARTKMRHGTDVDVTFSQTISESITFDTDEPTLSRNLRASDALVRALGTPARGRSGDFGTIQWNDVAAADVLDFLDSYAASDVATKAQPRALAEYIRAMLTIRNPELTTWTVGLVSVSGPDKETFKIGGHEIQLVERTLYLPKYRTNADSDYEANLQPGHDRYIIRRLVSPSDEQLDLSQSQEKRALELTQEAWRQDPRPRAKAEPTSAGGLYVRQVRSASHGLLLLYPLKPRTWMNQDLPPVGFAFSFPKSVAAKTVKYRVTNLWWDQEFGDQGDEVVP